MARPVVFFLLFTFFTAAQAEPAKRGQSQSAELNKLATYFKTTEDWSEPAKEAKLTKQLEAARRSKAEVLAPLLSPHLTYSPHSLRMRTGIGITRRYPVFGVLRDTGSPAVPALLDILTADLKDDPAGDNIRARNLAVYCLVQIYNSGGKDGRALARERVKEEADKSTGLKRDRLLNALGHPALQPE